MSTVSKPKPKFGWSEEVALAHKETIDIGSDELPCHLYGGDGGCLPRKRPEGRLEEILQCKARAPIAESPWASFAAQVIKFTGARRAMPTTNPGEIRYAKGDHYDPCFEAQDTVYVGVPVS